MSISGERPVVRWPALPVAWLRWALALVVFAWLGARHWPETVDDTVISIDYARQWAEGHGLTWTTGERVEGYSNFLLVAALTLGIHLGADAALLAQCISVAAVLLIFALLSSRLPRTGAATVALMAFAAFGPLNYWGMFGLEGPLFGLLLGAGWAAAMGESWALGVSLLALASVTRPEGPLYLGLALVPRLARPLRATRGDALALACLVAVLIYHAVRVSWFGAFWPTPYLVKVASVPWTRFGFSQMAGDLALAAPVLAALALAVRLTRKQALMVMFPLLAQSILLWRASGDWMTHGRLILPGLIATGIAWATVGAPRPPSWSRTLAAIGLALLAGHWMPVGYGRLDLEPRAVPGFAEVEHALQRGLDTPVSEDVLWAARNVPSGDRLMAIDAGMLGAIPELRFIDSRGLVHRGFAEAAASRDELAFMQALVGDPNTCPEWMRIANWDGAPLPALPEWLTSHYTLRKEVRYGAARVGWYAVHDRVADPATARRRLDALWADFPSQPFLAWHAALTRADVGDMEGAMAIIADGRRRWPTDPRFSEAPGSLSFPTGPFGLDQNAGRGTGLYWNAELLSRPLAETELSGLRLRLDADAPGAEGALATVTWSGPCGESTSTVAVRAATSVPPPDCALAGESRVRVAFTNDSGGPEGDRNLYATLVPRDSEHH